MSATMKGDSLLALPTTLPKGSAAHSQNPGVWFQYILDSLRHFDNQDLTHMSTMEDQRELLLRSTLTYDTHGFQEDFKTSSMFAQPWPIWWVMFQRRNGSTAVKSHVVHSLNVLSSRNSSVVPAQTVCGMAVKQIAAGVRFPMRRFRNAWL